MSVPGAVLEPPVPAAAWVRGPLGASEIMFFAMGMLDK